MASKLAHAVGILIIECPPHHFHAEDGSVQPSTLVGDPEQDIFQIIPVINHILSR